LSDNGQFRRRQELITKQQFPTKWIVNLGGNGREDPQARFVSRNGGIYASRDLLGAQRSDFRHNRPR
jgi:hypothetical protein